MKNSQKDNKSNLQELKNSIKYWLKANNLNYVWLAVNLNKSEGTVRNWLYSPTVNITSENMEKIKDVQDKFENKDSGLSFILPPITFKQPQLSYLYIPQKDCTELPLWLTTSNTLPQAYYDGIDGADSHFAEWVTTTIGVKIKQILRDHQEEINALKLNQITERIVSASFELMPYSTLRIIREAKSGKDIDKEALDLAKSSFPIPFFAEHIDVNFIALAVSFIDESFADLVTKALTDEAQIDFKASLNAFIEEQA